MMIEDGRIGQKVAPMTEELRAKMEELREMAPRLNKTSDSASAIIKAVEEFLNKLGIGIPGLGPWFQSHVEDTDDGPREYNWYLAYGRLHGNFCIHVQVQKCKEEMSTYGFMDNVLLDQELVVWSSCSRDVKLKSFATLPSLLTNILNNAKEQAEAADKAAGTVGEMLATLGIEVGNSATVMFEHPPKVRRRRKC
jgi:hypothetical protein